MMIAVNLVNNYKFSDFILDKITEEQNLQDEEARRKHKRNSLCVAPTPKEVEFQNKKRSSLRLRYSGEYTKTSTVSSTETITGEIEEDFHNVVTIETTDEFRLTADTASLHISLKQCNGLQENNVFRQIDFGPDPEGHGRLTVFQLLSNPTYYLATTHYRHLELQSYCDDTLDPDCPDERYFRCFHSTFGVELLQPYSHKGYYIHHIDDFIALRKLELNFRPPEEFFLYFKQCDITDVQRLVHAKQTGKPTDNSANSAHARDATSASGASNSLPRPAVPDISKSSLKRKDSKKVKTKASPITPKPSMLSCFGLSSLRKSKKKKDKDKPK